MIYVAAHLKGALEKAMISRQELGFKKSEIIRSALASYLGINEAIEEKSGVI